AQHFCSFCYLKYSEIDSLNYGCWKARTIEGHQIESQDWKAAKTHVERDSLFKQLGVRYLILNELPYWNPIKFVVVEPMHLLSGILEWHARRVWRIDEVAVELKKDKKFVVAQLPESENYFDEDEYEVLREAETNTNNNTINLQLLQDALMAIKDEMLMEDQVNTPLVFTSNHLKLIRR
ncbi:uncharacterized protein VP01_12842g1, partial [Puccinia sorghi]